jgi:[ribosomal protein S5]-alanine N-acetyltransferase
VSSADNIITAVISLTLKANKINPNNFRLSMSLHFETEYLSIDPLSIKDKEFIYKLVNTPGWLKYIGDRNVRSPEYALEYINRILNNENVAYWTVRLKTNFIPIGVITLIKREYLQHHDIGFAFLPEYSGKGYAFEASSAVINELSKIAIHSVLMAITVKDNSSSINLLERLGFRFDKMITINDEELASYRYDVPLK